SSKAVSKEVERIDNLFYAYADASSGLIDPEGIESFCSDLEVDYTDVRILMLAWKMKAEKQGYFTLEEWRRGLKALHADTISKLKKSLSELEKEVNLLSIKSLPNMAFFLIYVFLVARPTNFSDFYSYSFRYCLTGTTGINFPSLDNYDAELAWPLILDNFVEWIRDKQS
ncbi:hypothetical protein GW17_00059050, partial [Ensete ventricosum]